MRRLPSSYTAKQRLDAALREAWSDITGRAYLSMQAEVLAAKGPTARAQRALELVQSLPYRPDPPGVDVVQSATETAAYGGDCEDLAGLFVVLVATAGLTAALVWLYQPRLVRDHVSAQVWVDGGRGRWAETTIKANLGEPPHTAAKRLKQTHSMGAVG